LMVETYVHTVFSMDQALQRIGIEQQKRGGVGGGNWEW
jgi:hypothetical protein